MKVTAGVLIINEDGKYLAVHPTGYSHEDGQWSLPKGIVDEGESPIEAAKREVFEETGIDLSGNSFKDLGQHSYVHEKDIHLFVTKINNSKELKIHCSSLFVDHDGKEKPENDKAKWMNWPELARNLNKKQFLIINQGIMQDSLGIN